MQWAKNKQAGFTIVELLIVVVVIAILATITIVSYNGITARAYEASVESDLQKIAKKAEQLRIQSLDDTYPSNNNLSAYEITINTDAYKTNRNNFYYCRGPGGDTYSFGVIASTGQGYFLTNGTVRKLASGGVYQVDTCNEVSESDAAMGRAGFDYNNGQTWRQWINTQ